MPCPTCNKEGKEACESCELCHSLVYCSEECKQIGWSAHQCNVIRVEDPNVTVFMPSTKTTQTMLLQYVSPKGQIEQRFVEGEAAEEKRGEGKKMPKSMQGKDYILEINHVPLKAGKMRLGEDCLWTGAQGIAGRIGKSEETPYVFWSGTNIIGQNMQDGDILHIGVRVEGRLVGEISGILCLLEKEENNGLRKLSPLQLEVKQKFPRLDTSFQKIQGFLARDAQDNLVRLSVDMSSTVPRLLDVEYHIKPQQVEQGGGSLQPFVNEKLAFCVDPSNIDHITGLVMALEDKIASGELSGPVIQQQFDVINTHRAALEENPELAQPTPKIHAAVQGATQALWDSIDGKAKQRYYQDKLMRGGAPEAKALAQALADKMGKARARTGFLKRILSPGQKRATRLNMQDLETAILRAKQQYGLSEDAVKEYDEALDILKKAMNPAYQGD